MSTRPRLAKLATDHLARARGAEKPPAHSAGDAEAAIAGIARAIAAEAARRRRQRVLIGAGVLAAAAALALFVSTKPSAPAMAVQSVGEPSSVSGVGHVLSGGVVLLRDGHEVGLDAGSAVARGDRFIAAADGRASLDLSTGTRVVLGRGTDVAVTELGEVQRFMLRAGTMQADVAKLRPGQRFLIQTKDAEIEVRGTSFRVDGDVTPCGGSTTHVSVSEGTVVVRSAGRAEDRVSAGAEWPPSCVTATTSPTNTSSLGQPPIHPSPPGSAFTSAPHVGPHAVAGSAHGTISAPASATSTATPSTATASSSTTATISNVTTTDLAEQNRLYGEASAARHRGATSEAVAGYERFLARYPSSQLAENATVERMRLLAATNRAQGAAAARDYLARWPRGFARQEAQQIVQRAP